MARNQPAAVARQAAQRMKTRRPLSPTQLQVLRRYRATGSRDFPKTRADKRLASAMRRLLAHADTRSIAAWWASRK